MKGIKVILIFSLLVIGKITYTQNAPITYIHDTIACPGSVISVPVRVNSFNNIGSISLKLQYNTSSLIYQSWENTSLCPGLHINGFLAGTLVIGGFNSIPGGVSFPDSTIFFTVNFLYQGGTGTLTWFDNGASCEYAGPTPNYSVLNDIPTSAYYINGTITKSLNANFTANSLFPKVGDTVSFSDNSTGIINEWLWNFSPGTITPVNGTTLNSQNPSVTFDNNGPYTVKLTISNEGCSVSVTKTAFIHAGTAGLWTGIVSEDWNNVQNWHNWVLPDQLTNVVIPSVAPHYPDFPGDFTIGVQCYNLTIEGTGGVFTVQGNFVIP